MNMIQETILSEVRKRIPNHQIETDNQDFFVVDGKRSRMLNPPQKGEMFDDLREKYQIDATKEIIAMVVAEINRELNDDNKTTDLCPHCQTVLDKVGSFINPHDYNVTIVNECKKCQIGFVGNVEIPIEGIQTYRNLKEMR